MQRALNKRNEIERTTGVKMTGNIMSLGRKRSGRKAERGAKNKAKEIEDLKARAKKAQLNNNPELAAKLRKEAEEKSTSSVKQAKRNRHTGRRKRLRGYKDNYGREGQEMIQKERSSTQQKIDT